MKKEKNVRVAIAQPRPACLIHRPVSAKHATPSREAGGNGAKIILFPEAYIGGYPKGNDVRDVCGIPQPRRQKGVQALL